MAPALSELTFKEAFGRIGDVPDLVTISAEETVAAALDTMARTRVSTLAVTSATGKITALIGFHDIVLHVLRRLGADGLLEEPVDRVLSLDPAAESYRVWERDVNDTIAATLAEFTRGLHRALVTDVSGAVPAHVFSQSDAVNYLYLHPEVSPVDLGASLSQLGFKKAVVSVRDNVSAREAFKALLDASVLSAPIVDEDGWLKGTLSTAGTFDGHIQLDRS